MLIIPKSLLPDGTNLCYLMVYKPLLPDGTNLCYLMVQTFKETSSLTFIEYKQTNKQTNKKAKGIWVFVYKLSCTFFTLKLFAGKKLYLRSGFGIKFSYFRKIILRSGLWCKFSRWEEYTQPWRRRRGGRRRRGEGRRWRREQERKEDVRPVVQW